MKLCRCDFRGSEHKKRAGLSSPFRGRNARETRVGGGGPRSTSLGKSMRRVSSSTRPTLCLPGCISACLPVCLSLCPCQSTCLFVCLPACLLVRLSARLLTCLPACPCLLACLPACRLAYLPASPFTFFNPFP